MPYDSQGRWIEENEWQQMMREQAARRVGAFSRYNTPTPSVYPNQAAPYGSFGATPSVGPYQTSPFMRRQEKPATAPFDTSEPAPMYGPGSDPRRDWSFNNDPIALNESLSKPSFTDPLNVLNQQATGTITPTEDVNLAGMPFAGAVTSANELINKAPFVSANPLSVLAKTEMLPNIFNYDAGPVVQNVFDTIMPTADAAEDPSIDVQTQVDSFSGMPASTSNQGVADGIPERSPSEINFGLSTGNLAGYGVTPPEMLQHQMGLGIGQPANKYSPTGKSYWDSHPGAQAALDDDVAAQVDDFSEIAPVTLDTHSRYLDDAKWEGLGKSSKDFENWKQEVLPTITTTTPTIERVREFNAVTAGNKASKTAGGLDKIARDRLANQAAIEQKMVDDAARIRQQKIDEANALDAARRKARQDEQFRIKAIHQKMFAEERRQDAARQAEAQAEANAAIERVAQARAIMNSRDYQEGGMGNLSAAQRDVLAAAQVDTFAGMPMGGGFMGADIGREDGGGFTGGDFSGGAGWE